MSTKTITPNSYVNAVVSKAENFTSEGLREWFDLATSHLDSGPVLCIMWLNEDGHVKGVAEECSRAGADELKDRIARSPRIEEYHALKVRKSLYRVVENPPDGAHDASAIVCFLGTIRWMIKHLYFDDGKHSWEEEPAPTSKRRRRQPQKRTQAHGMNGQEGRRAPSRRSGGAEAEPEAAGDSTGSSALPYEPSGDLVKISVRVDEAALEYVTRAGSDESKSEVVRSALDVYAAHLSRRT